MTAIEKEVVYENISGNVGAITYVIKESNERTEEGRSYKCNMSEMRTIPEMTTTSKFERVTVACKCGYIFDSEINF